METILTIPGAAVVALLVAAVVVATAAMRLATPARPARGANRTGGHDGWLIGVGAGGDAGCAGADGACDGGGSA